MKKHRPAKNRQGGSNIFLFKKRSLP
jgi:hypothetical protein